MRINTGKQVVCYSEPFHYALNFLPFVLFMVIISKPKKKLFLFIACFIFAILMESLTLVVDICIIAALMLPLRRLLQVLALSPLFAVNLSYYTERLNFSSSNEHFSTLLYLQGWENATFLQGYQRLRRWVSAVRHRRPARHYHQYHLETLGWPSVPE